MEEVLNELKEIINIYPNRKEIRYWISSSRLRDKKFLQYFEDRRKNHNKTESSSIINTYNEWLKYVADNRFK